MLRFDLLVIGKKSDGKSPALSGLEFILKMDDILDLLQPHGWCDKIGMLAVELPPDIGIADQIEIAVSKMGFLFP